MLTDRDIDIGTVAQTPIEFHSFSRSDFVIISAMVNSDKDVMVLARARRSI
jgi:hypothetical protein